MPAKTDLGDLRRVSNKAWAHSADDLGSMLSNPDHVERFEQTRRPEPSGERLRKPSLNLRIEAYRNNLAQSQQQPSPSSFNRDFPSPGPSNGSASPLNIRFPNPTPEGNFMLSTSESTPSIGTSPSAQSSIHNRSNSYNVLGSTATTPLQSSPSPRHKTTNSGNAPNFTFSFAGKMSTPTRTKPEPTAALDRRASQLISHSGFLNRNASTSFPMNLSKNWKAYKAEIKGSKLYLFKPPSEKAAAVRDLFASEYGMETTEEAEEQESLTTADNSSQDQRRKRLFWGPGRHPDMLVDSRGVALGGTLDAILYELVFAAIFPTDDEEEWRQFATAVLLCLPVLVSHEKFEADISQVIDRYIRYTDSDAMRNYRRRRMEWLLATYAEYHHGRNIPPNLETFIKSLSLELKLRPSFSETPFKLPSVPVPTPKTPSERSGLATKSSFSRDPSENIHGGGAYADLRHKGTMSRERTMAIDTNVLAQSLELLFLRLAYDASQAVQVQPILSSLGPTGPWAVFSATERRPHWLTHFIVAQIVAESDRSVSVSSTHSRALVISKWARVADHARIAGNECMWKAILDALSSKPVARLEKVWRRVDTADRLNVEAWVKGESSVKQVPQNRIPWLTAPAAELARDVQELKVSLIRSNSTSLLMHYQEGSSSFQVALMQRVYGTAQSVLAALQACNVEGFVIDHADVLDLYYLWEAVVTKPSPLRLFVTFPLLINL